MLKELLGSLWTQEIEDALKGKVEAVGSEPKIPKSRFDEVNDEKNGLKTQVDDLLEKLKKVQSEADSVETLKTQITELTQTHDEYVKGVELEKVNSKKKAAVIKILEEKKALNPNLFVQFYDLSKLSFVDGGVLVGAKEITDKLVLDYPDQFGKTSQETPDLTVTDYKGKKFAEMTLKEKTELKQKEPEKYAQLRAAHYKK